MALCTVSQAAAALGVSVASVRRGIKTGRYSARQQPTLQGFTWLVELPDAEVAAARVPESRIPGAQVPETRGDPQESSRATSWPVQAQRAEEMALYSQRLLAPVLARLEAQATEIGVLTERTATLQATLEATRARVAELELIPIGKTEDAPPTQEQAGRQGWWARLSGWVSGA